MHGVTGHTRELEEIGVLESSVLLMADVAARPLVSVRRQVVVGVELAKYSENRKSCLNRASLGWWMQKAASLPVTGLHGAD